MPAGGVIFIAMALNVSNVEAATCRAHDSEGGETVRRLASRARRSAGIALPLAALLAAIGGGGAAASPQSAIGWHPLHLVNGWKSASIKSFRIGSPSYAISAGVVYLSGGIEQLTGSHAAFAVLPAKARPAHRLYLEVFTNAGVAGTLEISPTGTMEALHGSARAFTALTGISFPGRGIKPHALKLRNGWTSGPSADGGGSPAYAISGGIVRLSGSVRQPSGGSEVLTVLPKAARPPHVLYLSVYTFSGTPGSVLIKPDGDVLAFGKDARQFTSLAAISYPDAKTTWHKLSLSAGWKSSQSMYDTGDPSYAVIHGVVYLSGSLHQVNGVSGLFGDLPRAARPARILLIGTYALDGAYGSLSLTPSGLMSVISHPQTGAEAYTSLAAISYPRNS